MEKQVHNYFFRRGIIKKFLILLLIFITFGFVSCQSDSNEYYTNDDPLTIQMKNDSLKILQLTDLHLTYGVDSNDRKTFNEIKDLVNADDYDLIVITGDISLSPIGPRLFTRLVNVMESLKTPWTFVFGNHENDYNSYYSYLSRIKDTQYLYFKVGPKMDGGGFGNFRINFIKDNETFYTAYFLDSHGERKNYTEAEGEYDYFKVSQVNWYENHVKNDTTDSVMFFHIPLRQFMNPVTYDGTFGEDKVYPQGVDTGMFNTITTYGKTKGVFVGHDHLNDFSFMKDGVLLAYGQITGYNAYGDLPRGGREINVSEDGKMSSYIVLERDVVL